MACCSVRELEHCLRAARPSIRHAELILRERLDLLQRSIAETIKVSNAASGAICNSPPVESVAHHAAQHLIYPTTTLDLSGEKSPAEGVDDWAKHSVE
jgi:hypothetical protein